MECSKKRCGKEITGSYKLCADCRESARRTAVKYIAGGFCVQGCGNLLVTKVHCRECADKVNRRTKGWHRKNKDIVYAYYGSKCGCCGLSDTRFLSLDHVNNDGYKDLGPTGVKLNGPYLLANLVKNGIREDIQLLCFNCNMGKARNGGICPHKEVQ